MYHRLDDHSFLEISWFSQGTAGTGDVILYVQMSCEGFYGEGKPYFEYAEFAGFISELTAVLNGSRSSTSLSSDSGRDCFEIQKLDSSGHFCVEVSLARAITLRGKQFECGCMGTFELEWADLAMLQSELSGKAEPSG